MAVKKKSGLGKGLDAIFAENDTEANSSSTVTQPRTTQKRI